MATGYEIRMYADISSIAKSLATIAEAMSPLKATAFDDPIYIQTLIDTAENDE